MGTDSLPTDKNAEAAVIGSILLRPDVMADVERVIAPREGTR